MKITVAGDFFPQKRIAQAISQDDFSCFNEIKEILSDSDYSIVNFEAPIVVDEKAMPMLKSGPNLRCSVNALKSIKYAGFNCVTLANNHFYDYGDIGVQDTLRACLNERIDFVGGGENIEKAKRTLYKEICGETLAIVNFCEQEWSIATMKRGGSAPLDIVQNYHQIKEAKSHSDYVLVIVHGGREHFQLPRPKMKEVYHFFIDAGADAVVNHHQHCYSGYEVYRGKPIFYGLGNFCFDANGSCKPYWQEGYIVRLKFDKEIDFQLFPYIQCDKEPRVILLKDKGQFNNKIHELNSIIEDTELLEENYKRWIREHERMGYLGFIEPLVANRYVSYIWRIGILPSLWSRKKMMTLLNVIRCETHHDILMETIKQKITRYV